MTTTISGTQTPARAAAPPRAAPFTRKRWLLVLAGLHLISLYVFIAMLLLWPRFERGIERRIRATTDVQEFDKVYKRWSSAHARTDAFARPGAILFLGDSIMRDLDTSSIARHTINLAIPGETTARLLRRMSAYASLSTARGVVLSVGVNDLRWRSVEETLDTYRKLLATVPERTPVVMVAVLPVDERVWRVSSNAERARINEGLARLCAERLACRFIDPGPGLRDSSGNLASADHDGDGLHLSATGHEVYWRSINDAVVTYIPPALEDARLRPAAGPEPR